ncbi:MAG: hypothetical protein AAF716_06965 [Cyanobacteria bacterium P01_D01_bin.1]
MSTPATETFGQARQGSVAAIIQVLNERLADSGIRTRAVVDSGMLQLLCEAASPERLEKTAVVEKVRQILENISPHHIKRVKINSRIVKEEQLLWLEEINKDPENALLWSEIITLNQPFFIQRWMRDRQVKPAGPLFRDITESESEQDGFSAKLLGGIGIITLILATGWIFREDISEIQQAQTDLADPDEQVISPIDLPPLPAEDRAADTTLPVTASAADTLGTSQASDDESASESAGESTEAFAEAVRIAEQASADGKTAATAAEWLDLAARWQKAADLMDQVPPGNEQHTIAKDRVAAYSENSQTALGKAAEL